MGCDIHGAIEWYRYDGWRYVGPLIWKVGRSYDTFGSLFGVRNAARFKPLFLDRGFPENISRGTRENVEEWVGEDTTIQERLGDIDFHSATHVTLSELNDVDWSETAEDNDNRISVVDDSGQTKAKASYMAGVHESLSDAELERARSGERVELSDTDGEKRYAVHKKMTRKEALSGAWRWLIFDYLPTLTDRVQDDSEVRLVVWFDN